MWISVYIQKVKNKYFCLVSFNFRVRHILFANHQMTKILSWLLQCDRRCSLSLQRELCEKRKNDLNKRGSFRSSVPSVLSIIWKMLELQNCKAGRALVILFTFLFLLMRNLINRDFSNFSVPYFMAEQLKFNHYEIKQKFKGLRQNSVCIWLDHRSQKQDWAQPFPFTVGKDFDVSGLEIPQFGNSICPACLIRLFL